MIKKSQQLVVKITLYKDIFNLLIQLEMLQILIFSHKLKRKIYKKIQKNIKITMLLIYQQSNYCKVKKMLIYQFQDLLLIQLQHYKKILKLKIKLMKYILWEELYLLKEMLIYLLYILVQMIIQSGIYLLIQKLLKQCFKHKIQKLSQQVQMVQVKFKLLMNIQKKLIYYLKSKKIIQVNMVKKCQNIRQNYIDNGQILIHILYIFGIYQLLWQFLKKMFVNIKQKIQIYFPIRQKNGKKRNMKKLQEKKQIFFLMKMDKDKVNKNNLMERLIDLKNKIIKQKFVLMLMQNFLMNQFLMFQHNSSNKQLNKEILKAIYDNIYNKIYYIQFQKHWLKIRIYKIYNYNLYIIYNIIQFNYIQYFY